MSNDPHTFTGDSARRIAKAVRTVEANDPLYTGPKRRRRPRGDGSQEFIVAKVTANEPGVVSAVEQYYDGLQQRYTTIENGRVWDGEPGNLPRATVIDGRPRLQGEYVLMGHKMGPYAGEDWYVLPERYIVEVDCEASGSNGTYNTTAPNWTYTIFDKDSNQLATGLTPEKQRDECQYHVGTKGLAYLEPGGDWVLAWVNEEIDLPAAVGDNVGYYQMEANSPYGNGVTTTELAAGKIEFTSRNNAGEVPIYTELTDGAGTDVVLQYVKTSDLPSSGADGQGFESVTDGVNTLNKTDGGIIEFDAATPSADELAVEFTVTDNDPTATVTAVVDVSSLTGAMGGAEILNVEIRATDAATMGTTITVDTDNYAGRLIHYVYFGPSSSTDAEWTTNAAWTAGVNSTQAFIPQSTGSDFTLLSGGGIKLFTDQSDGNKLKAEVESAPAAGRHHNLVVIITKGARKTTADYTINT